MKFFAQSLSAQAIDRCSLAGGLVGGTAVAAIPAIVCLLSAKELFNPPAKNDKSYHAICFFVMALSGCATALAFPAGFVPGGVIGAGLAGLYNTVCEVQNQNPQSLLSRS